MMILPLSKGAFTVVDDDDYEACTEFKWSLAECSGKFYAKRQWVDATLGTPGVCCSVYLHRFLTKWSFVDHLNGISLDNRRSNLRPATATQNAQNRDGLEGTRSGFKGVFWHAASQSWNARITADRRTHSLRYYSNPEEAARAYDRAALRLHGEFARTNFPKEDYLS